MDIVGWINAPLCAKTRAPCRRDATQICRLLKNIPFTMLTILESKLFHCVGNV